MSLCLTTHQAPALKPDPQSSIIELIYAGHAMAERLCINITTTGGSLCVCGAITSAIENPTSHHYLCPVGRYYAAVETVRKAAVA